MNILSNISRATTASSSSDAVRQATTTADDDGSEKSERNDESQRSGVSGSSGHTDTMNKTSGEGGSNSSSSFNLAREETTMLRYSKILLLFVIAAVAVLAGYFTYALVKSQEKSEYHVKFKGVSNTIQEFSRLKAISVHGSLESFGATLTSYALDQRTTWPFVVFPHFQVRGLLSNKETKAHTISINPLVYAKDVDAWTEFTQQNQAWIAEAHAYDNIVHPELYKVQSYKTNYEHDETVRWNATGITPYMWLHNPDDRYARNRVQQEPFYAPIWQRAPTCDYATQINQDLRSDPALKDSIDSMLVVDHPVITPSVEATFLETNYEYRFDPEGYTEPHSYVLSPVYDTLDENRTMVAFLSAFIKWGAYFTDVLPSSPLGIFVILESSCGQKFTYEIFGHRAVYIGEGNLHDTRVDDDPIDEMFEFSPESAAAEGDIELCHYYGHVYPSQEWREQFTTSDPYVYAVVVVCCFLLTATGFLLYDVLVQRRQTKVMHSAERTNKIVASLFPENVRDRLLEQSKAPTKDNSGAFLNNSNKARASPFSSENTSEAIFGSKPIADLFPETTIMFADMSGFTAWSSTREPIQVFTLLETVYHSFDQIAKRRRVFKVETIGDCYVAVAGLPVPRRDHAPIMAKFATECLHKMKENVRNLESSLGPDTADLSLRVGLHSGPVTAGVLRGDKGRFQLFGDTMNTASRMESTGIPGKIHVSLETADALIASGRSKWVTEREDAIFAKGKGELKTFWLKIISGSASTGKKSSGSVISGTTTDSGANRKLEPKDKRLVSWNTTVLASVLKQVVARRQSLGDVAPRRRKSKMNKEKTGYVLDEVKDVLALPQFDARCVHNHVDPNTIELPNKVLEQLHNLVFHIAGLYHDNPFHSFEHASHVTMSVTKLLSRIVNPNDITAREGVTDDQIAANLHDHTFGITSDPLTQFACIISALIHDADHPGVPNSTLVNENDPLAAKYNNKSVAEQNSVDLAWDVFMSDDYTDLQDCIFTTKDEFERFRSIVVNVVMATDIMDKDLGAQRKARWEKAFNEEDSEVEIHPLDSINRKATIVLEHLMQASDVSHTMQHWVVFRKWNEKLFQEMYKAYEEGRSDKDPSESWYQGELGFFDFYIIPLAKKLETCGVFGVSSHEYLNYAQQNRNEWESKGHGLVQEYVKNYHAMALELVENE